MSQLSNSMGGPPALAGGPSVSPEGFDPVKMESKKLRDGAGPRRNLPVRGFGPNGDYTFYLPSPEARCYWTFKGGKPVEVVAAGLAEDQRIRELRDQVIATMRAEGPGLLRVEAVFLEYAAAVLLVNYNLTDDDLSFVLRGKKWHQPMVHHVLGGPDIVDALRRTLLRAVSQPAVDAIFRPPPPAPPPAAQSPVSVDPRPLPRPSMLRRLLSLAFRGRNRG